MNVDKMVESMVTGFRNGVTVWPAEVLASVADQVSEYREVTDEEVDAMLRTAVIALVVRAARAECARRVG
jgi:hypothetical protein